MSLIGQLLSRWIAVEHCAALNDVLMYSIAKSLTSSIQCLQADNSPVPEVSCANDIHEKMITDCLGNDIKKNGLTLDKNYVAVEWDCACKFLKKLKKKSNHAHV